MAGGVYYQQRWGTRGVVTGEGTRHSWAACTRDRASVDHHGYCVLKVRRVQPPKGLTDILRMSGKCVCMWLQG